MATSSTSDRLAGTLAPIDRVAVTKAGRVSINDIETSVGLIGVHPDMRPLPSYGSGPLRQYATVGPRECRHKPGWIG